LLRIDKQAEDSRITGYSKGINVTQVSTERNVCPNYTELRKQHALNIDKQ